MNFIKDDEKPNIKPKKTKYEYDHIIELKTLELEKIRSKFNRMTSDDWKQYHIYRTVGISIATGILLLCLLVYFCSKLGVEERIEAMKYGYERRGRNGTSTLFWTKISDGTQVDKIIPDSTNLLIQE